MRSNRFTLRPPRNQWIFRRAVYCVWLFALLIAAAVSWKIGPSDFYGGHDGKWTQNLIRFYLDYVPPLQVNALNPVEGDFSQLYPLNLWLNPANIQFTFLPFEVAMATSMLTFLAVLALVMYACARQLGLDRISAAIAAQCAIWFFPHFSYLPGIFPIYQLNPGGSITDALFILLVVLVLAVDASASASRIVAVGIAATVVVGYIVYNEAMGMGLIGFCMMPSFAVAVLAPWNLRGIAARLAPLVSAAGILAAIGVVQYVLALDYYTSRYTFRTEFPRSQIPVHVSELFFMKNSSITLGICAAGILLGLIFTRGPALVAVAMALVTMLVVCIAGIIYLFTDVQWWLPLPIYIEFHSFPLILIGAAAGYSGFLRSMGRQYGAMLHQARLNPSVLSVSASLVIPFIAVLVAATISKSTPEPYPDEAAISELFEKNLGLVDGGQWKGSVFVQFNTYRQQLTVQSLWKNNIPTYNENSQTSTPLYHFMTYRLVLARNEGKWDIARLAPFGVRYLMLPSDPGDQTLLNDTPQSYESIANRYAAIYGIDPGLPLRGIVFAPGHGYRDFAWLVYELPHPNYGQYSPTVVKTAGDAEEYRRLLSDAEFDWRRDVVMESNPGSLTVADDVRFYLDHARIRVEARNVGGLSLALLPIQYSHCLRISGTGSPQLVRANMFFAGLLFSGESRVWIDFDFGFTKSGCRWSDIADMKTLKLHETVDKARAELHPFAIKSVSDIPIRVQQMFDYRRSLP
jgi:hypothetical protein